MGKQIFAILILLAYVSPVSAQFEINADFSDPEDMTLWNAVGLEGLSACEYSSSPNFSFERVESSIFGNWAGEVSTWNYQTNSHDRAFALLSDDILLDTILVRAELDVSLVSSSGGYGYWSIYFCSMENESLSDTYTVDLAIRPDYRRVRLFKYSEGCPELLVSEDAALAHGIVYHVVIDMQADQVTVTGGSVSVTLPIPDEEFRTGSVGFGVHTAGLETVRGEFDNFTASWISDTVPPDTWQTSAEVIEDASLKQYYPNTNYGDDTYLHYAARSGYSRSGMYKFDLSNLPEGSDIVDAEFSIRPYDDTLDEDEALRLLVHHVYAYPLYNIGGEAWNEHTVTWNLRPTSPVEFNSEAEDNYVFEYGDNIQRIRFSVTDMVRQEHETGNDDVSIMIRTEVVTGDPEPADYVKTISKESYYSDARAWLLITLESVGDCDTPELLAPDDYAFIPQNEFFDYEWTEVEGAESYVLQLWYAGYEVTEHVLTETSFHSSLQGSYSVYNPYLWRVRANCIGGGESLWSETRHIVTDPGGQLVTVAADGSGDFPTIQAAIDAVQSGCVVELQDGVYIGPGNWDLDFGGKDIIVRSAALDPTNCVIDCGGPAESHRGFIFWQGESEDAVVEYLTIRNGYKIDCYSTSYPDTCAGGAILVRDASPTLRGNIIQGNEAWDVGGIAYMDGGVANVYNNIIAGNRGIDDVGGVSIRNGVLEGNRIYGNHAGSAAGGIGVLATGPVTIRGNLIYRNYTDRDDGYDSLGGGIQVVSGPAPVIIEQNTIALNGTQSGNSAATTRYGGGIYVRSGEDVTLNQCIVFGNGSTISGGGMECYEGSTVAIECCDYYGNDHGDAICGTDLGGNISEDPMFCSQDPHDFRLVVYSPCLPENNSCALLIGAQDVGCDQIPVLLSSFSATPGVGNVDLSWQLGVESSDADFRLEATNNAVTWLVPWRSEAPGHYTASDDSPHLASGGQISYSLKGQLPGESWYLLRILTVDIPLAYMTRLLGPFPNPFNPTTDISFSLAQAGPVSLRIHDLAGRLVKTLVDGPMPIGEYSVTWRGKNDRGNHVASGVYFLKFETRDYRGTDKLVMLK